MRSARKTGKQQVAIMGTRGIPAKHGGFETFAEQLSLYLKHRGWQVTVYCQAEGRGPISEDAWQGMVRVHVPVALKGAKGTVLFDWLSTKDVIKKKMPALIFGYNTAVFSVLYRMAGVPNIINMDGIEWRRGKYNFLERSWLFINEKLGLLLGNHLIADHPEIKRHLAQFIGSRKITTIPYEGKIITNADPAYLDELGLTPGGYALLVARPDPENSILEIVRAYSKKQRGLPLVVLGRYFPKANPYHKKIMDAAGQEIRFAGAIYRRPMLQALRFHSRFHIHGHTVGGTNPSLVEALGAGSAVLARNNRFNRWVAGEGALYFSSQAECQREISRLIRDDGLIQEMKISGRKHYLKRFNCQRVLDAYEKILLQNGF